MAILWLAHQKNCYTLVLCVDFCPARFLIAYGNEVFVCLETKSNNKNVDACLVSLTVRIAQLR